MKREQAQAHQHFIMDGGGICESLPLAEGLLLFMLEGERHGFL